MRTIKVEGTGVASFAPDTMEISINMEHKEKEYEKTMRLSEEALAILKDDLWFVNYPKERVVTTNFRVDSVYSSERDPNGNYVKKFDGYCCTQGLLLRLDYDMEFLGRIIGALSQSEAESDFNIHFALKDDSKAVAETLKKAVIDATSRAQTIAASAGLLLNNIEEITSTASVPSLISNTEYRPNARCLSANMAVDIVPEDIKTTQNVVVVWSIK